MSRSSAPSYSGERPREPSRSCVPPPGTTPPGPQRGWGRRSGPRGHPRGCSPKKTSRSNGEGWGHLSVPGAPGATRHRVRSPALGCTVLVGLNISPARLHAGSFSSPVFLEVQEQGQGCRDPRRGRATRGGRSSQPAGRRGHPRAVTRLCPPSQKWHKSGGFGNHNDSPRPGRISPFSRGWAVVIRGPKKPPDGGGDGSTGEAHTSPGQSPPETVKY